MSNYVVEVENLKIRFNLASEKVDNLKEYTIKLVKHELMFQEFLALQDVNLKIKKGESWGLVGANGSGKSTLLKTISGILKPYEGSVRVKGTIAPLIELGAGFDGNLTARENIYLNGMVLGHSRKFREEHFDEIVEFANLYKFLDSPIKNFSSGMKARLGFAVATVVNPDILIVDEVLEVGDMRFRKRCNERMRQMLSGGTTLLYVSHNIESVKNLCENAVWLDGGKVRMIGKATEICDAYKEMQRDAYENGYTLWISSAYRSVEKQQDLLDAEVSRHMREDGLSEEEALEKALQTMTVPGYSEHNTGLAIDLNGVTAIEDEEYEWLCRHAADYGFILRYPQGKEAVTGIQFEAWHFRYVGQEHAQYMVQHDMCLEEYIAYLIETGQF